MTEGVVFSIAEKVLGIIGQRALQELTSCWGARGDLEKLAGTIRMIKARVRDAERRHEEEGSEAIKEWLVRLKQVLYQADDLFDEVLTVDRQKQLTEGKKLNKEIRMLLSRSGPLFLNWKIAQEIKSIRQELDAIKSDMAGLNLRETHETQHPMTRLLNERETTSFVQVDAIIGREDEKNKLLKMLFDPKYDKEIVSVISIVGFGGMGKTTLAQLVFNEVEKHFDLTKWACVPEKNNKKEVLGKIFTSLTGKNYRDLPLEDLQSEIRESINNKKYLLVLDDVWDEDSYRWNEIMSLLKCGKQGSRVIVTTRSDVVARSFGTMGETCKLGTLADDASWNLFNFLALKQGQKESDSTLIPIGKEIVRSCGNVPLAVKVVGSLLSSRDTEEEWKAVRDSLFSNSKLLEDNNIMPILKLSYDDLPPALKQCFAYCSLFPKDYKFKKTELVRLWMAQGYVVSSNTNNMGLEEVGDQYFLGLLRRSFFQEVQEDAIGEIKCCKMHDLVHDMAQQVAANEIIVVDEREEFTDKALHISVLTEKICWKDILALQFAGRMRSLLFINLYSGYDVEDATLKRVISKFRSLRTLDLSDSKIEKVPNSIEGLRRLRYLDLSKTLIKCLSESITRLPNLQTLVLDKCRYLREWPRGFTKLVNLRHLGIKGCSLLSDMPVGFGKMKSLLELNTFIVGQTNGVDALAGLNLRGAQEIVHRCTYTVPEAKTVDWRSNQHLTSLSLDLGFWGKATPGESRLGSLLLPPNLKVLNVHYYGKKNFPGKMVDGLHKLATVCIRYCENCEVLPHLSWLPYLKNLEVCDLEALEYIDDDNSIEDSGHGKPYFPALETLTLTNLKQLRRWSKVEEKDFQLRQRPFFSRLRYLNIRYCPKLESMPGMPWLESLQADRVHGNVLKNFILTSSHDEEAPSSSSSTPSTLKQMTIYHTNNLVSLPLVNFCKLESLVIVDCEELRDLSFGFLNSMQYLALSSCGRLRNLSEGLCCGIKRGNIEIFNLGSNSISKEMRK